MQVFKLVVPAVSFLLLAVACGQKKDSQIEYLGHIDAPEFEIPTPAKVLNDSYTFSMPERIIVADSTLVIYDYMNQIYPLHLFNARTGTFLKPLGLKGRGPGEVISPHLSCYNKDNQTVSLYDFGTKKIICYDLPAALRNETDCYEEIKQPQTTYPVYEVQAWRNKYLMQGSRVSMRFGLLTPDSIRVLYTKFPALVENPEENISVWLYAHKTVVKPDGSKIVCGTYIGAALEILDISDSGQIKQSAFVPITKPAYRIAEGAKPTWVTSSEETTFGFSDIYATDRYIYTILMNYTMAEGDNDMSTYADNRILVFDWSGKPVCKIKLDRCISTLAVDEKTSLIYAFSQPKGAETPQLVSFGFNVNNLSR